MNRENIAKLVAHLQKMKEKNSKSFSMDYYFAGGPIRPSESQTVLRETTRGGDCGTVMCIGGLAALMSAAEVLEADGEISPFYLSNAVAEASAWLGIDADTSDDLFAPSFVHLDNSNEGHAWDLIGYDEAIHALLHLSDHGFVEWIVPGYEFVPQATQEVEL
jgi:hypothetical protein